jgi:FkbM family methyltransferase
VKIIIRKLLGSMGYKICRLDRPLNSAGSSASYIANKGSRTEVKVGAFLIEIPVSHPLNEIYQKHPMTQRCLVNMVKAVHQLHPDLVVVDVGANVGDTLSLIKTAADIPVICVEGDELCTSVLSRNVKRFKDATVVKTYLNERAETTQLFIEKEAWNSTLIPNSSGQAKTVAFATLDQILLPHPLTNQIRALKVDCEGFDLRILRGGSSFLGRHKPALLFELNYYNLAVLKEDGKSFLRWLASIGYSRFFIFENHGAFLFEGSPQYWRTLDDMDDYMRIGGNRLDYLDVVAFPDELESAASAFKDLTKAESAQLPKAGIDRQL